MNYVKLGKLTCAENGKIYNAGRRIFPSKSGDFLEHKYDAVISTFATEQFKKEIDKQIAHANIVPPLKKGETERDYTQLVAWRESCESKKQDARKQGKSMWQIQKIEF